MERMHFTVDIDAPRERVWRALWSDDSYSDWTSAFSPGSRAVSDWQEGSRIQFLDGEGQGMESLIEKSVPNEYMSFKHLGTIHEGQVKPFDQKNPEWSGSHENYTLRERGGRTTVNVDLESPEQYKDMFNDKFPRALNRLKEIAESDDR